MFKVSLQLNNYKSKVTFDLWMVKSSHWLFLRHIKFIGGGRRAPPPTFCTEYACVSINFFDYMYIATRLTYTALELECTMECLWSLFHCMIADIDASGSPPPPCQTASIYLAISS